MTTDTNPYQPEYTCSMKRKPTTAMGTQTVEPTGTVNALPPTIATTDPHSPLEIDPDAILTDPAIRALRAWSGSSRQELGIPELARMIAEEGQQVACIVRETGDGLVMVDGERRKAAVKLLRETEPGQEDFPLKIQIADLTEDQALRVAMITNIQRSDFTPIELARNIGVVRKRFGWEGSKGTGQVAEWLGVSPATVTQTEKLLDLPADKQADVHNGRLSATAALELITVPVELRAEVSVKAQRIADQEAEKKRAAIKQTPAKPQAAQKVRKELPDGSVDVPVLAQGSVKDSRVADAAVTAPAPAKVETKHVRQAQKSVPGALTKIKAPKMSEAIALIEQWDGPAYGAAQRKFASTFVEWARGKVGDKVLQAAWDGISGGKQAKPVVSAKAVTPGKKPVQKAGKKGKK